MSTAAAATPCLAHNHTAVALNLAKRPLRFATLKKCLQTNFTQFLISQPENCGNQHLQNNLLCNWA
jgi:hypothetical protein